jgi:hypothetical protein
MKDDQPANVFCLITDVNQFFLSRELQSTDKHLKLIVNFSLVPRNFLEFVSAHQLQDIITIQNGYKWFAPIWMILGQVKYLEATWE